MLMLQIEHLHYTAWPDHGVPSSPRSIVAFLQQLQRHAPLDGRADQPPIVVHCSAGVGRTGTLIVLDMCLHQAFSKKVGNNNTHDFQFEWIKVKLLHQ